MPRLLCPAYFVLMLYPDCSVLAALSWQLDPGCPAQAPLSCTVLPTLSWLPYPGWLPCPGCSVLTTQSWLLCHVCALVALIWLLCSAFSSVLGLHLHFLLNVLSWSSSSNGFPVLSLAPPFLLYACLSCPRSSVIPVLPVLLLGSPVSFVSSGYTVHGFL
jgi:hypothetical protein